MLNQIKTNIAENELYYNGEVIVKYTIKYPEIITSEYEKGKQEFNHYNREAALCLKQFAEGEFYNQAKETYDYNKQHGYPIMVYELVSECNISYNHKKIVSLYCNEYTFAGGAHGNTVRSSQTWDLELAGQIPLEAFFKDNSNYEVNIIKQINEQIAEQIKEGTGFYFPEYCQLVLESFNPENYYLTKQGIVIYFQQYEIAPYSSGIPEFLIEVSKK